MKTFPATCRIVFIFAILFLANSEANAQQLLDDFNRTSGSSVGTPTIGAPAWTEVENGTGSSTGCNINSSYLRLSSSATAGREYVWRDCSGNYNTVLSSNAYQLTWQFKMQQTASSPDGFNSGVYGMAVVIGCNSSNFLTGNGYAVVLGQPGSTDPIRLVRFNGGLSADANLTNIVSYNDFTDDIFAVKVVYTPSSNLWELYVDDEDEEDNDFSDVSYNSASLRGSGIDNALTGQNLKYLGALYNHSTSTSSNGRLDEIYIPVVFTQYYSKATGDLNLTSTWGTNLNGSGASPANFTAGGMQLNIRNNPAPTISAAWAVTGGASRVTLGDSVSNITFTIPATFAYTGATIDISPNSKLVLQHATVPTIGNVGIPSVVEYASASTQTITPTVYWDLICTNTGGRTWASGTTGILNTFSAGANAFNNGSGTVDFMGSQPQFVPAIKYESMTNTGGGDRIFSPTGTIEIRGTFTPSIGNYTVDGSTINFTSSSDRTLPVLYVASGPNYNNVMKTGSGDLDLEGPMTIGGSLTITSGEFRQNTGASIFPLTINGNLNINGGDYYFSTGTGANVLTLKGNLSQTSGRARIDGSVLGRITFAGTGVQTITASDSTRFESCIFTVVSGAYVKLGQNLALHRNTTLALRGQMNVMAGGTLDCSNFRITSGIGTSGNVLFNLNSGATLVTSNTLGVLGSIITPNMLFTFNSGASYKFNANILQATGLSNSTMTNLTIENNGGVILQSNLNVNGAITFLNGKFNTTSSFKISLASAGTVSGAGAGKYVNGTFEKFIPAGTTNKTFEIGDATSYNPVSLVFPPAANGTGSLIAKVNTGDHPSLPGSGINPSKTVNRNWNLVNNGVNGILPFDAEFSFNNPADMDATANPLAFVIRTYRDFTWYTTNTGNLNLNKSQATAIPEFGDFELGEPFPPPTVTCPVVNVNALTGCSAIVNFAATYTGNPSPSLAYSINPGTLFHVGFTPVTVTVGNINGTASCTFDVVVHDVTFPVIHDTPSDITTYAAFGRCDTTVDWIPPYATDNCNVTSFSSNHNPGDVFSVGTTVVTYTASDSTGNITTSSFNVIVIDDQFPVLTNCPTDTTLNTNGLCGIEVSWIEPTVSDNCPDLVITPTHPAGSFFPTGTTNVVYTATDASGNATTCSFNVTVIDDEDPVITCPAELTVNSDIGVCGAVVILPATATDNCSAIIVSTPASGSMFPIGTTLVTSVATDPSGNSATCSYNVIVVDNEPPVISCPDSMHFDTDPGLTSTTVTFTVGVTDNCSATVVSTPASGSILSLGATTVTSVATDASGNTSTCSFVITVGDHEAPLISGCPNDTVININGPCSTAVTWTEPTASDNDSYTMTSDYHPGDVFAAGTTLVTYTVIDAAANISTCAFQVLIVDNEFPTITCPNDTSVENNPGVCGAVVTFSVLASDNCSVNVVSTPASGSVFPVGTTTVNSVATDVSGNVVNCSFNITVVDTSSPVISCAPDMIVNNDPGNCGAIVNFSVGANDNCAVSEVSSPLSGTYFSLGTTTVNSIATDASGNTATCSFTVTVKDNEPPVISCSPDIYANTDPGTCSAVVNFSVGVTDNCSATVVSTPASGSVFPIGITTVTSVATDNAGNSTSCTFLVTVHNPNGASSFSDAGCESYNLPWNATVSNSGIYNNTYTSVDGCDSVVTANITINHNSTPGSYSVSACNSYTLPWGGDVVTSGDYENHYQNISGCDSLVTAHVTINVTEDNNPCTVDGCDTSTGTPVYTAVVVDDNNLCTTDGCNTVSGIFHDIVSVDDNNLCTDDGCYSNTGVYHNAISPDDNNVCTSDGCDSMTGISNTVIGVDDGNACTTDACDPSSGPSHIFVNVDDANACTADGCDSNSGVYHNTISNDDNSVCTTDGCDSNTGVYHNALSSDDNNVCTSDACDSVTGISNNTISVDDGNVCTTDGCDSVTGAFHNALNSNDDNACTTDGCDSVTGIFNTVINVDDHDVCTTDACNTLTGPSNTPVNFDDNDVCTADACDPATGPSHTAAVVDDGNACTADGCDSVTGIFHDAVNPDDNNACTVDACNTATGVTHTPVNPDDNNVCTTDGCDSDTGQSNTPIDLSDNNVCTTDACDPVSGPYYTAISSDDNNACTNDGCDSVTGIFNNAVNPDDNNLCTTDGCDTSTGVTNTPVSADDNNVCTDDACDPSTGISNTPINIDDNNVCTTDACDSSTGISHTPIDIDDNNVCTTDACDSSTGISHTPIDIDDNNVCTADACDSVTGPSHSAVSTDDGDACTVDGCDSVTGLFHTALNVDDDNVCTTDGCNSSTGATHTDVDTDDNNACTTDGCDSVSGIFHSGVNPDDNNLCTTDACNTLTGVTNNPVNIHDNNICTVDACDPSTGISNNPIAVDDGNICTNDGCHTLNGIYHNAVNADDNNACTIDGCNTVTGITNTEISTDDNNICTIDGCDSVTGLSHVTVETDDHNGCTVDGCSTSTGIFHNDINTDDGNACTTDGCISSTGLITHTLPNTDDGNPCTTDACNTSTGSITHTAIILPAPTVAVVNNCVNSVLTASGYTGLLSWSNGANTPTITVTTSGMNYVTQSVAGCTSAAGSGMASLGGTAPSAPLAVNGPAGACRNTTGIVFSIAAVAGAESYLWTLPVGATGTSTGTSISVNFSNTFATGSICVRSVNHCGQSAQLCRTITRITTAPGTPGTITGPANLCPLTSGTYSVAAVANATSYNWVLTGGLSILNGAGTNSIVVSSPAGFVSGTISVSATNCISAGGVRTLNAKGKPSTPIWKVAPPTSACGGSCYVFNIDNVQDATSWTFLAPAGASVSSPTGTPGSGNPFTTTKSKATICFPAGFTSGIITIYSTNACGQSTPLTYAIGSVPALPALQTGPAQVCKSQFNVMYSIPAIPGATSYTWTISGGASIMSGGTTNIIRVRFTTATSTAVNLSVRSNNGCGSSAYRVKPITVNLTCKTEGEEISATETPGTISSLLVYPNPTKGKSVISFTSACKTNYLINVVDITGKVLISESFAAVEGQNMKEIDCENIARGLYFVTLQNDKNESGVLRLIVE